ncbi:MAG: hypothetical protein ACREUU_02845 [Gammaproteobacteria bacterium]
MRSKQGDHRSRARRPSTGRTGDSQSDGAEGFAAENGAGILGQSNTQEIFRARVFEEPLVPIGGEPSADENTALAAALVHEAWLRPGDGQGAQFQNRDAVNFARNYFRNNHEGSIPFTR